MQFVENLVLAGIVYLLTWLQSPEGQTTIQELIVELEKRVQAAEADLNGQASAPSTASYSAPSPSVAPSPVSSADSANLPKSLRGAQSSVPAE